MRKYTVTLYNQRTMRRVSGTARTRKQAFDRAVMLAGESFFRVETQVKGEPIDTLTLFRTMFVEDLMRPHNRTATCASITNTFGLVVSFVRED